MEALARIEAGDERDRLCRHRYHRRELALLEEIERRRLVDVHRLDLKPKPFEHRASGIVRAAALDVEAHLLAGELADVRLARPGDVGDVPVGVCNTLVLA